MIPTDSNLAGEALREHVDVEIDTTSHALQRARLVTAATTPTQNSRPIWLAGAVGAAAIAIALLLWLRLDRATEPLTFTVGPDTRTGQAGIYYAATPDAELPLRFSDGSQINVQARGGVRVHETGQKRVSVFVETGRARFDVAHRPHAGWEIAAGPYSVSVTGTAFDLSWTPESRSFELAMRSGSVTVRGPGIESGVVVKGNERFVSRVTANVKQPAASVTEPSSAPSSDPLDEPKAEEPKLPKGASGAEKSPSSKASPDKSDASWSELAAKGDYASIVRAAEDRGIDQVISGASADELRALADAARFSGRPALAQRALLAIRSRFAGSKAATGAAFVLGRMVDGSDAKAAIAWYDRYLAEGGPMAAEALGRRMLALRRSGDNGASRKAAIEYLRRFPDGPYSRQAQELSR